MSLLDWFRPSPPATPPMPSPPPPAQPIVIDSPRAEMAARLLRQCEGCKLAPYQDTGGVWTSGMGTTRINGVPVTGSTPPITPAQADAFCEADMQWVAAAIAKCVTVDLADNEWAALASFTYNEGAHALQTSTLVKLLNAGDRAGAAGEFGKWTYAGGVSVRGLVNRRALEKSIFLGQTTI